MSPTSSIKNVFDNDINNGNNIPSNRDNVTVTCNDLSIFAGNSNYFAALIPER